MERILGLFFKGSSDDKNDKNEGDDHSDQVLNDQVTRASTTGNPSQLYVPSQFEKEFSGQSSQREENTEQSQPEPEEKEDELEDKVEKDLLSLSSESETEEPQELIQLGKNSSKI